MTPLSMSVEPSLLVVDHGQHHYAVTDGMGDIVARFPYTFDGFLQAIELWIVREQIEADKTLYIGGRIVNPCRLDLDYDGLTDREADHFFNSWANVDDKQHENRLQRGAVESPPGYAR